MIGISHRSSCRFRVPFKIFFLFFKILNLSSVNSTAHPSSHNCPTEINYELFKSGSIIACCAADERAGDIGIFPEPKLRRDVLSGWVTDGPISFLNLVRHVGLTILSNGD